MIPWFNRRSPSSRRRLTGVLFGLILTITISGALLAPKPARAQWTTFDVNQLATWVWEQIQAGAEWAWEHGAAIAFKNAARTFSQRIAYDTAVMLASGGQGQTPLLSWRSLGQSAERAFDDAAGDFLETLDTENGFVRLGICQPPRASFQLFVGLTAFDEIQPRQPRCSLSQISQNWETFFADPDNLLQRFGVVFDPRQNDLGVALSIQQNLIKEATVAEEIAKLERLYQGEYKPVTESITGFIKTPAGQIQQQSEIAQEVAAQDFNTFTGDIIADALGVFTNTLASRLMKRLLQGTIPSPSRLESGQFGLGNLGLGGVEYAVQINSTISTPQLVGSTSAVDVISEFSNCPPDPAFYTPLNACTITQRFAQALRKADEGTPLTVKEAIEQGYIDGNLRFALVRASDDQRAPTKAWYLSDLRKLRRARIVPLGWELAAEQFAGTSTTLRQVMEGFSVTGVDSSGNPDQVCDGSPQESIYCGLVDPNWVLRAPPAQCRIEAYGQQLEPQGPNRQKTCVDYQHCIAEKADGSCVAWGYCKREENIWRFSGASCEFPEGSGVSPWGTCMSYRDPTGRTSNYLANSLANYDDGTCSDAASCRWYSAARNPTPADPPKDTYLIAGNQNSVNTVDFNLDDPAASPRFYLKNTDARKCDPNTEGCTRFLQLTNIDTQALGLPPATSYADQVQAAVTAVTTGVFASYEEISSPSAATLRQAPEYLNCYDANPTNDAPECSNYLKICYENEVGCELYTPRDGSPAVPGKVESANVCPGECNGFNTYTQTSSFFENFSARANPAEPTFNFIPSTAQVCSAQYAGCSEFTNVEQAERREYYSELRQCVRPEDNLDNTYYTWVGSDLTGYQLKTWQLQATDPNNPLSAPYTTDGSGSCELNATTNPDCKEFYATSGSQVVTHYRYETKVIYSSTSCNRYRATSVTQEDCGNSNGTWEGGRCFYRAIPNQGKVCPAAANACREYRGPTAGNVRLVMPISTFGDVEPGVNADPSPLSGWESGSNSTESTAAFGHSLASGDDRIIQRTFTNELNSGKQYILTFWAKADTNLNQTKSKSNPFANFFGVDEAKAQVGYYWDFIAESGLAFTPTNEWQIYSFGPVTLSFNLQPGDSVTLGIEGTQRFFIDNIAFREVQDTFFIRKGTWVTPNTCLEPQHLRCSAYTTRSGQTAYLTGFESICRNNAIGCRALVDTRNSTTPQELTVTAGDQTVVVPEDRAVFRVYDSRKSCATQFAGCSRVGLANYLPSGELSSWTDVFTVLNPDTFDPAINLTSSPLCSSEQNMCQVFTDANGTPHYFKDPGNRICEYKLVDNNVGYDWYKQGTNERCNLLTNPSFELLASGTVGDGAADEFVSWNPVTGSGVLEALPSLNGPQYWGSNVLRVPPTADGVQSNPVSVSSVAGQQRVIVLYAWVRVPTGTTLLSGGVSLTIPLCTASVCQTIPGTIYTITSTTVEYDKWVLLTRVFRTTDLSSFNVRVAAGSSLGDVYVDNVQAIELSSSLTNDQLIEFAKVPFAYQCPGNQVGCTAYNDPELTKKSYYYISSGLEKGLCNGQVSEKEGCLLFNDVSQTGNKPWGAATTYQSSRDQNNKLVAPLAAAAPEVNNTNLILKVRRDRTCAEWLSCQSESPRFNPQTNRYDTICYALGACNQLGGTDEGAGRCANWVVPSIPSQPLNLITYLNRGLNWSSQEYSGYSLPHTYPIETLSQKEYGTLRCGGASNGAICYVAGSSAAPCDSSSVCALAQSDIRLTYINPTALRCNGVGPACGTLGATCVWNSVTYTCQYEDLGLSGQGPGEANKNTSPKLCRAYPQKDSPYPESVVQTYGAACADDGTGSGCPTSGQYYIEVPKAMSSGYKDAYACQDGEVCECSYQRLTYRNGDNLFYSLASGDSVPKVYATDATIIDNNVQLTYTRLTRKDQYIGLRGYCLEKDPSRLINAGSDLDQACLTWLPIDVVGGDISIYDYSPEAGFTNANIGYYCSQAGAYQNGGTPFQWVRSSNQCTGGPDRDGETWSSKGSIVLDVNSPPIFKDDIDSIVVTRLSLHDYQNSCNENSDEWCYESNQNYGAANNFCGYIQYDEDGDDDGQDLCHGSYGTNQGCNTTGQNFMNNNGTLWRTSTGWNSWANSEPWDICSNTYSALSISPVFDSSNKLVGFNMYACSDQDSNYVSAKVNNIQINLKTIYCSELTKVTDGIYNKAWTNRMLNENSGYSVTVNPSPLSTYSISTETEPYGVVVGQLNFTGGTTLSPLVALQNNISTGIFHYAFGPYACETRPNFSCAAGNRINKCVGGNLNGQACATSGEPCPGGVCVGLQLPVQTQPPASGANLIQNLFAKLYGVFGMSQTAKQYDKISPDPLATVDISDTAGSRPIVASVLFDQFNKVIGEGGNTVMTIIANGIAKQDGNIDLESSDAVTLAFYAYNANGDQMPLRRVYVDWGDGHLSGASGAFKNHKHKCEPEFVDNEPNPNFNWGDDPRACVEDSDINPGYFSFTHVYTCGNPAGCSFIPKVFVEDNWEWCAGSNASGNYWRCNPSFYPNQPSPYLGADHRGWIPYSSQINVSAPSGTTGGYVAGPMTVLPSAALSSCGNTGGPFSPSSRTYQVTNTGSATMSWAVVSSQAWLTVTPVTGTLGPGGSATVTAFLNAIANNLGGGTYSATLTFANTTNNNPSPITRTFNLQVLPPGNSCSGGGQQQQY